VAQEKKATEETVTEREVVRCQSCGLVQFRTKTGNCRRCLRALPPPIEEMVAPTIPQELPGDERQLFENWPNRETVENIGVRIRQLREARGMTQSQLQARSGVSRSYLSRIESGQMTPSLGTLEKIAESLGVGLNRFFIPATKSEALLEDPFIQGVRPYLRQLDFNQWQSILKRLQAISEHMDGSNGHRMRPMPAHSHAETGQRMAVAAAGHQAHR
jgi:transcriptional regulator with XRE-family HTH domain